MKLNLFKDREFDLNGLIEVLIYVGSTSLAFLILILICLAFAYHPVIMGVSCASVFMLAIIYGMLKEVFNLIFPKKIDKEKRQKEINDWIYRAKTTFEKEEIDHD